jgi:hypothetical protein
MVNYSNPFKKRGTLHRWKFVQRTNGTTSKTLQYFHRQAKKWLDCKNEDGSKITSLLEGR